MQNFEIGELVRINSFGDEQIFEILSAHAQHTASPIAKVKLVRGWIPPWVIRDNSAGEPGVLQVNFAACRKIPPLEQLALTSGSNE